MSTRSWVSFARRRGALRLRRWHACRAAALLCSALIAWASLTGVSAKPVVGKTGILPVALAKSAPTSLADLKEIEHHVEGLIRRVSPATVAVRVNGSGGTGVVISPDGFVLCAAHVCGAPQQKVYFTFPNGRTAQGRTLGTNHGMDSGLMKIADPGPWPCVEAASAESARVGDWVLALGHPGGFDPERPTVARLGRLIRVGMMLQTDCTLISGDSGGPLFDMSGHVIAIHSRISDSTADNFHVPIGTFLETWDRLAAGELWGDQRPPPISTIGVHALDAPEGCRIESVPQDGPASRAGLLPGDLIVQFQDESIPDAACLVHCVRQTSPGDEVTLSVKRDGQIIPFTVKVEARRGRGFRPR